MERTFGEKCIWAKWKEAGKVSSSCKSIFCDLNEVNLITGTIKSDWGQVEFVFGVSQEDPQLPGQRWD